MSGAPFWHEAAADGTENRRGLADDGLWTLSKISAPNSPPSLRAEGKAIHAAGRGDGIDCFVPRALRPGVAPRNDGRGFFELISGV